MTGRSPSGRAGGPTDLSRSTASQPEAPIPSAEWRPVSRYLAPPPEAQRKPVLLYKVSDATMYTAKWVDSETMGPVWATPDGHVIFGDVLWTHLPAPPASAIEARRAETPESGSVHESAVPQGDAL